MASFIESTDALNYFAVHSYTHKSVLKYALGGNSLSLIMYTVMYELTMKGIFDLW